MFWLLLFYWLFSGLFMFGYGVEGERNILLMILHGMFWVCFGGIFLPFWLGYKVAKLNF